MGGREPSCFSLKEDQHCWIKRYITDDGGDSTGETPVSIRGLYTKKEGKIRQPLLLSLKEVSLRDVISSSQLYVKGARGIKKRPTTKGRIEKKKPQSLSFSGRVA